MKQKDHDWIENDHRVKGKQLQNNAKLPKTDKKQPLSEAKQT